MKHFLFLFILMSLFSCKKEIEPNTDSFDSSISNLDTIVPTAEEDTIYEVSSYEDIYKKEDWFLTRALQPHVSTKNLFDLYGVQGFSEFKSKEDYWKDENVRAKFGEEYGSEASMRFDEKYEEYKKEFSDFKLGIYQRSPTGSELLRNNLDMLRATVTEH